MFPPTWSSPAWTNIDVTMVKDGAGAPDSAVSSPADRCPRTGTG